YERRGAGPTSEPQPPQLLGIALPLLGDLDPQVQMDLAAQQRVDLGTGPRPNLPQPRAAPADDDPLLAVALDEQRRTHHQAPLARSDLGEGVAARIRLDDLLDHHRDRVRQLVAHALERRLADQLRDAVV